MESDSSFAGTGQLQLLNLPIVRKAVGSQSEPISDKSSETSPEKMPYFITDRYTDYIFVIINELCYLLSS